MTENPVGPPRKTGDSFAQATMENKSGTPVSDWTVKTNSTSNDTSEPVSANAAANWNASDIDDVTTVSATVVIGSGGRLQTIASDTYTAPSGKSYNTAKFAFDGSKVSLDGQTYNS